MKHFFFLAFLLLLTSCFGYKPIFSSSNINYNIKDVKNLTQDKVTNYIVRKLKSYKSDDKKEDISLEISSSSNERVLSKDTKGDPIIFEMNIIVDVKLSLQGRNDKYFQFISQGSSVFEKKKIKNFQFENCDFDTFDNILKNFKFVDFIKIDIEGSEYEIMPEIIKNKDKIKMVLCETHGNPNGKKIPNINGSKLVVKNEIWIKDYQKLISKLKEMNLYENWFYEWY